MISKRLLSTSIYFGQHSLNRVSFLRKDPTFIANALTSPYSKIILFNNNLEPIVNTKTHALFTTNYSQLGSNTEILDDWIHSNREKSLEIKSSPLTHFLGLSTLHYSPFKYKEYSGTPYFAIDISSHPQLQTKLLKDPDLQALTTREEINKHLSNHDASIFSQAKMYLEWLKTTAHCKGCGAPTIPINAGSELLCSSSDEVACPVKTAPVSNASFPRLDPVLITCVMRGDDEILLTRHSKFPKGMYTCIAGFIEPGETIENAVKREVWEESGLLVDQVEIVKSQPWPFPTNIMIGCIAKVDKSSEIKFHDDELQDCLWVPKNKVHELIQRGKENDDLTIMIPDFPYGIPNDKTLAYQLYKHAVNYN